MESLINSLLGILLQICDVIYVYKIPITIVISILILFYRLILANLLYVKRHDKADWFIFGGICIAEIIITIVQRPWIWVVAQIVLLLFMYLWACHADQTRQVKTVIYSNSVVYEDNSDKYDEKDGDSAKAQKMKDGQIIRRFTKSRAHMSMGMPVLVTKFIFRFSATATEEQLAKCVSYLNKYYSEYNWRRNMAKSGVKYEITAELKTKTNLVLKFNKEISDQLDWCVVPIGAIDISNKETANKTPYVWMMHDPKSEGKSYECLKETKLYTPAPQAFCCGQTGGGKSVLINTIIAHFVNKAKTDRQTKLYLIDPKMVEFMPYTSLKEVEGVALSLDEAVDLTNQFCKEMHKRNSIMKEEGMKSLPLDGKVNLQRHIDINGHIIYGMDVVEYKLKDGSIHKNKAMNLLNFKDDIIEVNIPEEEVEEEKKEEDSFGW